MRTNESIIRELQGAASMMRLSRRVTLFWALSSPILLLAMAANARAEVYKFVDEHGIVNYTNTRPETTGYQVLSFPCYASDRNCRKIDWHKVPLNRTAFKRQIDHFSEVHAVDPALVRAIIHAESAFNVRAESPAGAQGLMQLVPASQQHYGVTNPFDADQNINAGTEFLAHLVSRFKGDTDRVLAAYNAGETAVARYSGIPPFEETVEYIRRVGILLQRYERGG